MRVVFMGTPDFAEASLRRLIADGFEICAVYTQPDKAKGRGMELSVSPVKACALEHGIPVIQPTTFRDEQVVDQLRAFSADIIAVVAYGKILPDTVLASARLGAVNLHGSILPKYRGAAPIQQAVLDGEPVTGVTTMLMDVGLDTGDILLKKETAIGENETSGELFDRLAELGGDLIVETLRRMAQGDLVPQKQDEALATHTKKIDKSLCPIDFNKTAQEVHNQVRGLSPWPVATTELAGKKIKVHATRLYSGSGKPGELLSVKPLVIACAEGAVEFVEVQPEGKKRMSAEAFAAGYLRKETP